MASRFTVVALDVHIAKEPSSKCNNNKYYLRNQSFFELSQRKHYILAFCAIYVQDMGKVDRLIQLLMAFKLNFNYDSKERF